MFRDYQQSEFQKRVEKTYKNMLTNQDIDFVNCMKNKYNPMSDHAQEKFINICQFFFFL